MVAALFGLSLLRSGNIRVRSHLVAMPLAAPGAMHRSYDCGYLLFRFQPNRFHSWQACCALRNGHSYAVSDILVTKEEVHVLPRGIRIITIPESHMRQVVQSAR